MLLSVVLRVLFKYVKWNLFVMKCDKITYQPKWINLR